MTAAMFRDIL